MDYGYYLAMEGVISMAKGKELQETRKQGTPMHPLKIYQMYDINGKIDVPYHWHDNVEILWIQKGRLSLMVKDVLYTGKQGDVFYINPRELHGMNSLTHDCTYLAFIFPLQWLQFAQADEAGEKYLKPLGQMGTYIINCLPAQTAEGAVKVLKEIYSLYQKDGEGAWLGIKAGMLLFYYYIYRDRLASRRQENSACMDTLMEISLYIQENCQYPLTLKMLGDKFHMSPKYFSVYFQKHFARNFSDYLMAVRIENAKKILAATDAGMELVAQQSGFSSSSYFIRVFKEASGITPGQYRREFTGRH